MQTTRMLQRVEEQWTLLDKQRAQLVKDLAHETAKARTLRAERERRNGG